LPDAAAAVAGDAMADAVDPAQFLDVEVDELAGSLPLVAVGWLSGSSRLSRPSPIRVSTAEVVLSGIRSTSLISAAVIRIRRSAAIAAIRSSGVRCGITLGAELRSSSPRLPSAR
jgi:hypothetical protein